MDITQLILSQHEEQRRAFALLDDVPRDDVETLAAVWSRLEVLLEVHAEAEERFFYPRLLQVGKGATGVLDQEAGPDDEVEDAVKDHDEIRDGIRRAREADVGSDAWWEAVFATREANDDHMGEEERDDLPDFRRHASLQERQDLAVQFLRFEAQHADGVPLRDKDPEEYVRSGGSVDAATTG